MKDGIGFVPVLPGLVMDPDVICLVFLPIRKVERDMDI
jgi:hypothetical protein